MGRMGREESSTLDFPEKRADVSFIETSFLSSKAHPSLESFNDQTNHSTSGCYIIPYSNDPNTRQLQELKTLEKQIINSNCACITFNGALQKISDFSALLSDKGEFRIGVSFKPDLPVDFIEDKIAFYIDIETYIGKRQIVFYDLHVVNNGHYTEKYNEYGACIPNYRTLKTQIGDFSDFNLCSSGFICDMPHPVTWDAIEFNFYITNINPENVESVYTYLDTWKNGQGKLYKNDYEVYGTKTIKLPIFRRDLLLNQLTRNVFSIAKTDSCLLTVYTEYRKEKVSSRYKNYDNFIEVLK